MTNLAGGFNSHDAFGLMELVHKSDNKLSAAFGPTH
jgi:hypothetical protein